MTNIVTKTRIAEETSERLTALVKSLKGWNLVSGLYSHERRSPAEDIVHALAVEAREIVLIAIRLTCHLGGLALSGDERKIARLRQRLTELDTREKHLATRCYKALNAAPEEAPAMSSAPCYIHVIIPHGKGVAA